MHEQHLEHEPTPETERALQPRLYVASLSDYNNGLLHGTWIDADPDPEVMQDSIDAMLAASPTAQRDGSPAEEWAIHDYEQFGAITINEHDALSTIADLVRGLTEHGLAFAGWVAHHDRSDGTSDVDRFLDEYLGEWDSTVDYAEHLLDDLGLDELLDQHIPSGLRPYVTIDAAGFARDLELGGDIVAVDTPTGRVWIYHAT